MIIKLIRAGALSIVIGVTLNFAVSATIDQGSNQQDLLNKIHDYSHTWWVPLLVKTNLTFNVSDDWWPRLLESEGWGVKEISNFGTDINERYKRLGLGDLEDVESANNNDRDANKPTVESKIESLKNKVSFTLNTNGVKCGDTSFDLCHRYITTIGEFLANDSWVPKGDEAHITLTLSPTAKAINVSINPDGKHFTITAPANVEVDQWDDQIIKGLKRGGKVTL